MKTKDRFEEYILRENEVVYLFRDQSLLESPVSTVLAGDQQKGYDRILVLQNGREVKVEIQFSNPDYWKKFHEFRFDVLSAFTFKPGAPHRMALRVERFELEDFWQTIKVDKRGKLYMSQADILAYYIPAPVHLLCLLTMPALRDHRNYFLRKYGLVINKKGDGEDWQSAFVLVDVNDRHVQEHCTIYGELA